MEKAGKGWRKVAGWLSWGYSRTCTNESSRICIRRYFYFKSLEELGRQLSSIKKKEDNFEKFRGRRRKRKAINTEEVETVWYSVRIHKADGRRTKSELRKKVKKFKHVNSLFLKFNSIANNFHVGLYIIFKFGAFFHSSETVQHGEWFSISGTGPPLSQ